MRLLWTAKPLKVSSRVPGAAPKVTGEERPSGAEPKRIRERSAKPFMLVRFRPAPPPVFLKRAQEIQQILLLLIS